MASEYGDFGRKIGGARKDLANFRKLGGFDVDDVGEWTEVERSKHITKKEVFVKPDYKKMLETGEYSREALYFQSQIYAALPTAPNTEAFLAEGKRLERSEAESIRLAQDCYIRAMKAFRTTLPDIKNTAGIVAFSRAMRDLFRENTDLQKTFAPYYTADLKRKNPMTKLNRALVTSSFDLASLSSHMAKDKFLYDDDQKALADAEVFKYDGSNIYFHYHVRVQVSGEIPYNGGDPMKEYLASGRGRLIDPEVVADGDVLKIKGDISLISKGKTFEEAKENALQELREVAEKEPDKRTSYNKLGSMTNVQLGEVEWTDKQNTGLHFEGNQHRGTLYRVHDKPEFDISKFKEGTYVAMVLPDSKKGYEAQMVGSNFETKEEAERAAIKRIQQLEALKKAYKDSVKKGRLAPPQLLHVHRVGEDYLDGGDVEIHQKKDENGNPVYQKDESGEFELDKNGKQIPVLECPTFQQEFGFSGGEFGNWESQADRRVNLNMAYEAFKDMAKAIGVAESDMSLGNELALAWGARGKGGIHSGVAHFEPDRNVINLTKMRGAGALGHEWGHALDYAIARQEKRTAIENDGLFETDTALDNRESVLHDVMNAMRYKEGGGETDFFKDAQAIDDSYARADKGYWASSVEMFARAFHTYLLDKMKEEGVRNDYLCGHAEISPVSDKNGGLHYAYPRGEERKRINQEFDKVIEKLKERGIFHEQGYEPKHQLVHSQDGVEQEESEMQIKEALDGQLEFDMTQPEKKEKTPKTEKQAETSAKEESTEEAEQSPAPTETAEAVKTEPTETAKEVPTEPKKEYGTSLEAENLKVGDVIRLEGTTALDSSTMKPVQLPPEYARVTEVDDKHINFVCSYDDPTVPDKWDNSRAVYVSTEQAHWSDKLAEHGFEVVSKAPEEMHIVYLRSGDDKSIDSMRRFIDMSYENANWNDDNSAVELSDSDFKDFKKRIESPDLGDYMKETVALVELSYDEPFPEDRPEPDFYHTIYLKGDATDILRLATTLDEITDFKADVSENFQTIKILDSDLEKYNAWLQSDEVQKNADLIGHISRIDQSLDEPFAPDKFFESAKLLSDTGLERDNWRKTYSQEVKYQLGEHTTDDGVQPITVTVTARVPNLESEPAFKASYAIGDNTIKHSEIPQEGMALIQSCAAEVKETVRENIETAKQFLAEQAKVKEEAKKAMAEQATHKEEPARKGWRPTEKPEGEAPQKRSFLSNPNLKQLEETMKEHKPFAAMAISTTNKPNNPAAEPVRMVVQEYVYDEELKRYKEGIGFDKTVKCSKEQLDFMLTCESYDYFGSAGLDKDAYIRGEGVLSKEQFNAEFLSFMKALEQDGKTLLIINGGTDFARGQLAKLSPEAEQTVRRKDVERTAVSQTSLTKEYFKRHGIDQKLTLENLRDAIVPSPTGSFKDQLIEGTPRWQDFQNMTKEEFCKEAKVTVYQYDATKADFELHAPRITGTDNRVAMIARFAETDAREQGILESEFDAHWREASIAEREKMSEQGKERYENADYEKKLEILVNQHAVNPEAVTDRTSDCDLNKFLNIMEKKGVDGEGHNKGFTVLQVATTGFDKWGVGEPIQVSAVAYSLGDDGTIGIIGSTKPNLTIMASERAIQTAIRKAEATGKEHFDAFAYTGIDANAYRSGEGVLSKAEAKAEMRKFFEKFPPSEYPIVSNGRGKGNPSLTFSQEALRSIDNAGANADTRNCVDFTQVIKEYSYASYHNDGVKNVLGDVDQMKKFSLEEVVKSNEELSKMLAESNPNGTLLGDTAQKVAATGMLADEIRMQDMELHRPEMFKALMETQQQAQETPQAEAPAPSPAPVQPESEKAAEVGMEGSAPSIGGMGGIDGISAGTGMSGAGASVGGTSKTVESDYDEPDFDEEPPSVVDLMDKSDLESLVGGEVVGDTREHGNLYSDKKGDTRDVVIVEGDVKKVAEVEIPHISEAAATREQESDRSRRMADKQQANKKEHPAKPRFVPKKQDAQKQKSQQNESQQSHSSAPSPVKTAPSADDNKTIQELLNLVKAQQELIAKQQEQLASKDAMIKMTNNTVVKLTERLSEIMDNQTKLLAQIAEQSREPAREAPKSYEKMSVGERVDAIEHIRDEIAAVRDTSSSERVQQAFGRANEALASAATEMEKEVKPKQPTTPNKAG